MLPLLLQFWLLLTVGFLGLLLVVMAAQKLLEGVRGVVTRLRPALQPGPAPAPVVACGGTQLPS